MQRLRTTTEVDEDRISNLPNEVICQVLSCLPTKDAVRTCVLSQQWNSKCIFFYGVDIDFDAKYNSLHVGARFSSFPSFKKRQAAHDDVMIRSFRLGLGNNRELVENPNEPGILTIGLLRSISSSASLTMLKIILNCSLQFPAENCFPNLKSLYLDAPECEAIEVVDQQSSVTKKMSLTFPALEVLELRRCTFKEVKLVEINVSRLIRFSVYILYQCKDDYKIEIYGPQISELSLSGCNECWTVAKRASTLLQGAPSLKRLKLDGDVAEALVKWKGIHVLPAFDLLQEVEFVNFCGENSQMNCVEMFLKFVTSLERVTVRLSEKPLRKKNEIRHQLSTFVPKSTSCVIDVIEAGQGNQKASYDSLAAKEAPDVFVA